MSESPSNRNSSSDAPHEPLLSNLADDEDMIELIDFFVSEMKTRVSELESAWQSGDEKLLRDLAHQLKGAAASYGFPCITDCAGELEHALLGEQAEVSALTERVESLIDMCRRASASGE
jgi:HPt (histidine-containing phosphotransfer) domain-containing protein